jgi:lipopolysaccharide/colanic/teichoic acid biosynthesis glycosyltransferase
MTRSAAQSSITIWLRLRPLLFAIIGNSKYWSVTISESLGWLNILDKSLVAAYLTSAHSHKGIVDEEALAERPWHWDITAKTLIGLIPSKALPILKWRIIAKTIMEKLIALFAIVLCLPLIIVIGLSIKLESRGPIFFIQRRYDFNHNLINIVRFRTMYIDIADAQGAQRTVRNDPRVSRVGRFLRRVGLDKLPQLLNVLRGDMSIIGPPPIIFPELLIPLNDSLLEYLRDHMIKPGLTGWAQVNGIRDPITTLEKARALAQYEWYYLDHQSILFDIKILLKAFYLAFQDDAWVKQ